VIRRRIVFTAAVLAVFTAAVEGTIVATAMPTIVADLGGLPLFTWVFAVYFLTQAVSIPLYGRLSDLFGRKRTFLVGCGLFMIGSILCGSARGMTALIVYRAVQGIGAGGVQPVATTVVADLFSVAERPRVQAILSSTWGIAAVLGPVLGAFLVEKVSWSAIFWINVPICILCLVAFAFFFDERVERAAGPRPLLPLALLRNRVVVIGAAGNFTIGMLVMSVAAFMPTYVQSVLHGTAFTSGIVLAAFSVSWSTGSIVGGRMMARTTYRLTAATGALFMLVGGALLILLDAERGVAWATIGGALFGFGFGPSNSSFLVAAQSSVEWAERGSATAALMFMRMVGQAAGTSAYGALFNLVVFALGGNVEQAVHQIFMVALVLAVSTLALAYLLPPRLAAHAA
jgi:MFS family permease